MSYSIETWLLERKISSQILSLKETLKSHSNMWLILVKKIFFVHKNGWPLLRLRSRQDLLIHPLSNHNLSLTIYVILSKPLSY